MKTVILGGTGLLGSSIYHNLISNKYNCLTTSKNKKSNLKTNHLSKNIILKFLKKNQPKLVINCVAETNVDLCNKDFIHAYKSNVLTVRNFVTCLNELKLNCFFVHISTDQVYDSKKASNEKHVNISNNYAHTKFLSEYEAIKYKKTLILRTNFYGQSKSINRKSFSDFIISNLKKKAQIRLAENIFYNPVHLNFLNTIILRLIKKKVTGIFNLGSKDFISKYDFGLSIAKKFNLDKKYIIKYKSIYKKNNKPLNTFMNTNKLIKTIGIKMPLVQDGIELL
tara:strand:+ start:1423 stop:2265 length:843 start_codon:yes stop_codon:yes gene_type:complete